MRECGEIYVVGRQSSLYRAINVERITAETPGITVALQAALPGEARRLGPSARAACWATSCERGVSKWISRTPALATRTKSTLAGAGAVDIRPVSAIPVPAHCSIGQLALTIKLVGVLPAQRRARSYATNDALVLRIEVSDIGSFHRGFRAFTAPVPCRDWLSAQIVDECSRDLLALRRAHACSWCAEYTFNRAKHEFAFGEARSSAVARGLRHRT